MALPDSTMGRLHSTLAVRWASAATLATDLRWMLTDNAVDLSILDELPVDCNCLLGVDVETGKEGETQLVQLSTATRAVLFRFAPLLAPTAIAQAALAALVEVMGDREVAKVGCELRRVAAGLLYDSGGRVCLCQGFDVSPAIVRVVGENPDLRIIPVS